jgi:hypothetical protein
MIENYFERYELFIEFMFIQLFPNYLKLFEDNFQHEFMNNHLYLLIIFFLALNSINFD